MSPDRMNKCYLYTKFDLKQWTNRCIAPVNIVQIPVLQNKHEEQSHVKNLNP